jgi:hypothetical protein
MPNVLLGGLIEKRSVPYEPYLLWGSASATGAASGAAAGAATGAAMTEATRASMVIASLMVLCGSILRRCLELVE